MTKTTMSSVAHFKGNLVIGPGTGIDSVSGVEAPLGCVPTPRMSGTDMFLGPRPRHYDFSECALHMPEHLEAMKNFKPTICGLPCPQCGRRPLVRVDARYWVCTGPECDPDDGAVFTLADVLRYLWKPKS